MRIFLIYQRYIDEVNGTPVIGGLQTYMEHLGAFAGRAGYPFTVIQRSVRPFTRTVREEGPVQVVGVVQKHRDWTADQVAEAHRLGDPDRDLIIFGTTTQVRKHRFRRSIALQHGIYWDVPTLHGRRPPFPLDVGLRAVQAVQQISWHRRVSRMICVDYNYVNWLRALTVDRSLAYTVIPNAAELPTLRPHTDREHVRLIFARRFETIRGVELIMELLPRLLERYPRLLVTLAGGGSLEQTLKARFAGQERVRFVCYAPSESLEYHLDQDIAIVPTIGSEGTSLSLLEAMAAGCAVVCSDVGGLSNLILDRFNGRILPPETGAFYEALCELIDHESLRRELAANGRRTVEASFSLEAWEGRWGKVLEEFAQMP